MGAGAPTARASLASRRGWGSMGWGAKPPTTRASLASRREAPDARPSRGEVPSPLHRMQGHRGLVSI